MEGLITFFVFIIVIIICVCVTRKTPDSGTAINTSKTSKADFSSLSKNPTLEINGVKIHFTNEELEKIKQQEKQEELKKFNNNKKNLLDQIKTSIKNCDDIVKKKVFEELLKFPLETQADYDRLKYIYNNGSLRSNEDVKHYDYYISTEKQRANFDKERRKVNILAPLLSFIIAFILVFAICKGDVLFGLPFGFIFGCLAAYLGTLLGYKINLSNAKDCCIQDNDPRVIDEKRKRAVGIAAGVVSGISIGRHAKSNAKELLNPDSWKEMK